MSKHILLIDDEPDIREVVALSLESVAGWRVTCAASGRDGVELAQQIRPDAILLDVMMPEQDGPTSYALIRDIEELRSVPVLFLTAKGSARDRQSLIGLGAAGTISKPFEPLGLAEEIRALLNWQ